MELLKDLENFTTRAEIARKAGLSKPAVSDIFSGKTANSKVKNKVFSAIISIANEKKTAIEKVENEINRMGVAA